MEDDKDNGETPAPEDGTNETLVESVIGFDALMFPNLIETLKEVSLNIICIGEPCIGKTSLMNSIFFTKFGDEKTEDAEQAGLSFSTRQFWVRESGIALKLRLIESIGFTTGNSVKFIADFITTFFEEHLRNELSINRIRTDLIDTLPNVCFYFISKAGLKPVDFELLKVLQKKVAIIPVIPQGDTLTDDEKVDLKAKFRAALIENRIRLLPDPDKAVQPFITVSSSDRWTVGNMEVRGRIYAWGKVEENNPAHSETGILREWLLQNVAKLKELTALSYESFRNRRLRNIPLVEVLNLEQKYKLAKISFNEIDQTFKDLEIKEEEMRNKEKQLKEQQKLIDESRELLEKGQVQKAFSEDCILSKREPVIRKLRRSFAKMTRGKEKDINQF